MKEIAKIFNKFYKRNKIKYILKNLNSNTKIKILLMSKGKEQKRRNTVKKLRKTYN